MEARCGGGAVLGEIPAAKRGYDGDGGAGMTEMGAGVTEVEAGMTGVGREWRWWARVWGVR